MLIRTLLLFALAMTTMACTSTSTPQHWDFAPTPPLGWNSWDIFGTTLTEQEAQKQAKAMAEHLLPAGYDVFTVDIQWYEPNSSGHVYKAGAPLQMDEYSRLTPALTKFPSAADGNGFKPLADEVHALGLRFGIHIMRGIPRQAVHQNTPILGTDARAADIANTDSTCSWNPDMFGVDMSKPGAQAYYDSLFQLYASWGVDYIKVDDIARPYDEVQLAEIEAIRRAIDKTGRPIVLSLSPGDTPIERGEHVMNHANLWRISDDFWDRWPPLYQMFGRLNKWAQYRANGAWPDADMLPFGIVDFGRPSRFTENEQILCMTLWCIARSPLIFGGDMTKLDQFTTQLLTNPEVLAVNQNSANNRQLTTQDDLIVWAADVPDSDDHYVALFNAQDNSNPFTLAQPTWQSEVIDGTPGESIVKMDVPIKGAKRILLVVSQAEDTNAFDHAAWIQPTISGPSGSIDLSDREWASATIGWGDIHRNADIFENPLVIQSETLKGIGTHAHSVIEFELPPGYETFTARGILTQGSEGKGSVRFQLFVDPEKYLHPETSSVTVNFKDLGFTGNATVRDLWKRKGLGTFTDSFSDQLPLHGAGLYRISPAQ